MSYSKTGAITGGFSAATNSELSAEQAAELLKEAQVRRVANLLAKADQAVVPAGTALPEEHRRFSHA